MKAKSAVAVPTAMEAFKPHDRPTSHRLTATDLRRMNLPEEYWNARLVQSPEPLQKFIKNYWDKIHAPNVGLLFHGNEGVGKTAGAALLLKKARSEFRSCYFTRVSELRENLRSEAMFDSDVTVMSRVQDVEVLVLDGLNESYFTGWPFNLGDAFDLIASRGSRGKVTHVTTSSWKALATQRSVRDELGQYLVPLHVQGENRRRTRGAALEKLLTGES